MIEVFGVTTRGRSSSMTEPAGNVLLIVRDGLRKNWDYVGKSESVPSHDVTEGDDHN